VHDAARAVLDGHLEPLRPVGHAIRGGLERERADLRAGPRPAAGVGERGGVELPPGQRHRGRAQAGAGVLGRLHGEQERPGGGVAHAAHGARRRRRRGGSGDEQQAEQHAAGGRP
jgi:hypothetical protein